ncbi:M4 family metallopeptidase [Lacinutrix sp. Bg11-31]|uniref:M4 family metallopeptidase n=1 Tax=Lacinutrix sp. Bg11-31 TaxID=2057808 RepID=UPI000C30760C|nr:M4 family metallopeptidase [Lacinutrix sp. Bg11-31]AUC80865.1 bacillolysin [Lacinutrix sp. Bg11-31]
MKTIKSLFLVCFLFSTFSQAQNTERAIENFKQKTNASVTINKDSKVPEFIRFSNNNPLDLIGSSVAEKAFSFLNENKELYKIEDVSSTFKLKTEEVDNIGFQRVVLNQYYNGVSVYDGKLLFHFNSENNLTAINGNYITDIKLNAAPSIAKTEAHSIAIETIENQDLNYSGAALLVHDTKLYIFQKGLVQGFKGANYLVYEVEIRNENDVREFVFVNAHNGTIVEQFTGMAHAIDRIVFEGDTSNVIWQEGDAFPGALDIWQRNEVEASGHVYHFFNNTFGYTSYDGADAQMRTINNNPNVANASWNGSTANYRDGTAADDVIAHEWGHAYTEYTSGLVYAWQSGAINESYSDIWGETIDLLNNYEDTDDDHTLRIACQSSDRWRMGEDASFFSAPIRDLWDPTCNGHPGKVTDGNYWCSDGDSGGVHVNSGVPNHAYALMVDGGNYNGQVIVGIGFTKAAHVFWRAQSLYLTATSNFIDLANALETSANDLLGVNLEGLSTIGMPAGASGEIITAADIQQVTNAVLAVELRIEPIQCGFSPILADVPPTCDAGINNPIFFEDWETGTDGWTFSQVPTGATWTPRDWEMETSLPNNRAGNGVYAVNAAIGETYGGDCQADFQNGIIQLVSPVITMPNVTTGTYELAFNHYVSTEISWDGGNVKYKVDGAANWTILPASAFINNAYNGAINGGGNDNPMQGQVAFTGTDPGSNKGSWGASVVDLSSLGVTANGTVQFSFDFGTDGCNGREGWYLDEVNVYNCDYALSVSEIDVISNMIKVYPNPSNGTFNLKKIGQINLVKAEINDINGRFIKTVDLFNMNEMKAIDLSNAASGLYFMTITSDEAKSVIKLMKQ